MSVSVYSLYKFESEVIIVIQAIYERRSIRKFSSTPIAKEDIREIIHSGIQAPSSKNRQPWKFIVLQGKAKDEMLEAFCKGVEREEFKEALLPESKKHLPGAKHTIAIIRQAPVVLLVVNPLGKDIFAEKTSEEKVYEICNIQSISAAIQNMLLTATQKGIGSLWICDIFFAYKELVEYLQTEGELVAAVALGYPNESPRARPRRDVDSVTEWR